MFSSYTFWPNLLFILWFYLISHCLRAGFVTYTKEKMMIPDSSKIWTLEIEWLLLMVHIVTHPW